MLTYFVSIQSKEFNHNPGVLMVYLMELNQILLCNYLDQQILKQIIVDRDLLFSFKLLFMYI